MNTIQLNRPAQLDSVVATRSQNPLQNPPQNPPISVPSQPVSSQPVPSQQVCCCYVNRTAQFQIIRIATMAGDFIERTVLPHAKILFEANSHDRLEVHTGNLITSILSDTIPCHQLVQ